MKILLTGGGGFIGKNILQSPLAQKFEIFAPNSRELNLLDAQSVDAYFAGKTFDAVLHAAVKPSHRNAKDSRNTFFANVMMFENLVRHRSKYGRFIDFGSGAIYDISQNITCAREECIGVRIGTDEHGFCKYVLHKRMESLEDFIELNIFGIFGRYEDYAIRFISNAICKGLYGLPITLRQNRRFSYLYIDDLYAILDLFLEAKPKYKCYNVAPNGYVELKNLANLTAKICGATNVKIASDGFGLDYYGDNARLTGEFPEIRFTPIEIAVAKLANFYRENIGSIDKNVLLFDK